MAGAITKGMPTPEIVKQMLPGSGATGTFFTPVVVRIPVDETSTANARTAWINPESGTVMAIARVYWTTVGSAGTYDVGVSSDGTGSNDNIINGGTADAIGVVGPGTVAATAVTGHLSNYFLIGPGGTGTNNSIVMVHNMTTTGTQKGALVVEYIAVGLGS